MSFRLGNLRELINEALRMAYELLGVPPNADAAQIRTAYRKLALELHPDRNKSPDATTKMAKVNRAFELLSNPGKRSDYDRFGDTTLGDRDSASSGSRDHNNEPDFSDLASWIRWQQQRQREQQRQRAAQQERERQNQPPPKQPPPSEKYWCDACRTEHNEKPKRQRFTFVQGRSRKFWWIERHGWFRVLVGWGKLGTTGQTKLHTFNRTSAALKYIARMVDSKLKKGYTRDDPGQAPPPPRPNAGVPPTSPPKQKQPSGRTPKSKTSYKIYGRKGKHNVHTRYGGRVYAPIGKTGFKPGDRADVAMGSDGRLTLSGDGRTQFWDASNESVIKRCVNEAVWNYIDML